MEVSKREGKREEGREREREEQTCRLVDHLPFGRLVGRLLA